MADADAGPRSLSETLSAFYREKIAGNYEGFFVFSILMLVVFILYVCDHRLTFLNLYFIPVLLAGYFLNTRSAVLGSLLSLLVVGFFVVESPESFMQEMNRMVLYLYLVAWGSILLLTGALVGTMTEQLRERFAKARVTLERLNELQDELRASNRRLEEKNLALEGTKAKVEAVLHYTMDPAVAKLVINRQLRNEKREISVLFADLENFTSQMENMPPEVAVSDLNRLFGSMEPILTIYRGHLDKYIGDGLMAEFGVPYFSEHHALLATLAGSKMQARMAQRDFPWKMRIGIATGTALVGLMGSENRKNYTAIGDTVNLASRLQAVCPVGGVCVDERTHAAIARWFHTRRIRTGLSTSEAQRLEDNLAALDELMRLSPRAEHCIRAAEICAALGEPERAVAYERRALSLEPERAESIHRSLGQVVLNAGRGDVAIRGKRDRVAAFEVLGLKDPLDDAARIPRAAAHLYEAFGKELRLPLDALVPLEAVEGAMGHAQATAALSAALAHALGLAELEQRDAFLAGLLHDIGKRNLPETLLVKPEPSAADRDALRSHAAEAEAVLRDMGLNVRAGVIEAIRQHHERFDGSGYPAGASGESIGLLARVVQIADEYEALTAWRPYHEPWHPDAALAEIERDVQGGRLDPKVGAVFLRLMRDRRPA